MTPLLCLLLLGTPADGPKVDADGARVLWQTGKYAEALDAFDALQKALPAEADAKARAMVALGRAEALVSQGERDQALKALEAVAGQADLLARRGEILVDAGRWEEGEADLRAALKVDAEHLRARWASAKLDDARGERERAAMTCKAIVDGRNARPARYAKDAEALCIVGQAAERYYRAKARGEDIEEQLNDVINEIYEPAIAVDPNCWQAAWLQGRLFLSGYREGSAKKELTRARRINPQAAEVLVTLGRADLEGYKLSDGRDRASQAADINPEYAPAYVLLADLNISDERFADALDAAHRAAELNPRDQEALARLAAANRLLVQPGGALAAELAALAADPRPSAFYSALGERLADRRKYLSAERAFLLAIDADPGRPDAKNGLGMLYMQVGREEEARSLFADAFAADPFNVRADNMLKVLKWMAPYKWVDSAHYRVLYAPGQDELHGRYMSAYLESIHEALAKRFGYSVPGRTKIEVMPDHQGFSGRTTGQPFIPTVGACTGKIVALASPKSGKKPYNWSRVLTHELTHVITLRQTDFNIPHWYTEALAVESEETPRPQSWNTLLMARVPARKLLNLDNINLGFIRPKEADDRQMAYCQAQLYARYMVKRFGDDANVKMLSAYRRGLTTDRAIKACFEVEKADFEAEYLKYLDEVVKTLRTRVDDEPKDTFSQLERKLAKAPDDADLNARMAYEHFARRDLKEARPLADRALELKPHQPLASYVKARLLMSIGDESAALAVLEPALDPARPDERVVDLLADLRMKAGKLDDALALFEVARRDDPYQSKWIAGMARVRLRQMAKAKTPEAKAEAETKLLGDLQALAANDADDLAVRKTLADYHLRRGELADAERWATECLYIAVYDPAAHVTLADTLAREKKYEPAIAEYKTALELKAKPPGDVRVKLAGALRDSGKVAEAKAALDEVLKADPGHPGAKALRGEIKE